MSWLLKSKGFWTFAALGGTTTLLLLNDRHQCASLRHELQAQAAKMGEEPLRDDDHPRRITIVACARDAEMLKRQEDLFRKYAVDLLTRAGVDYQWMQLDIAALNKDVGENACFDGCSEVVDAVVTKWIEILNGKSATKEPSQKEALLVSKAPYPRDVRFFMDGVVSLDGSSFSAMLAAIQRSGASLVPNVGLIDCETESKWYMRLYYVFRTAELAERIGRQTLTVINGDVAGRG